MTLQLLQCRIRFCYCSTAAHAAMCGVECETGEWRHEVMVSQGSDNVSPSQTRRLATDTLTPASHSEGGEDTPGHMWADQHLSP